MGRLDGDVDLLAEIVGELLPNSPRLLSGIETAIESGSIEGLQRAAHSLKGAVGNFAAKGAPTPFSRGR